MVSSRLTRRSSAPTKLQSDAHLSRIPAVRPAHCIRAFKRPKGILGVHAVDRIRGRKAADTMSLAVSTMLTCYLVRRVSLLGHREVTTPM